MSAGRSTSSPINTFSSSSANWSCCSRAARLPVRAVVDKKRVERDAVGAGENLRAQNVQPGGAQRAGDFAEQSGAVPGADFDDIVAAVGFIQPGGHGRQRAVVFEDQLVHETVREFEIVQNFLRRVNLEIPRRQRGKVRVHFLGGDGFGRQFADFLQQQFALFFLGADKFRAAGEQRHRARMQLPEQRILEAVPQFVARALRIGEGQQREQVERLGRLHLSRKIADDRRVVEIAPLRHAGHEQVVFDESRSKCDAAASSRSRFAARIAMSALTSGMVAFFVDFRLCPRRAAAARDKAGRGGPGLETAARNAHAARPSPPTRGPVARDKPACVRRRRIDGKTRAARGRSACRIQECICRAGSPRAWRAKSAPLRRGVPEWSGTFRARARRSENRGPPAKARCG